MLIDGEANIIPSHYMACSLCGSRLNISVHNVDILLSIYLETGNILTTFPPE
jgi:hypothetical protein